MKIRTGFVTNSSSSSYVVVYKVNDSPEVQAFIKEEFGNFGIKEYLGSKFKGDALKKELSNWYGYDELDDYIEDVDNKIKDDEDYLYGSVVTYTTEGDTTDQIFTIIDHLPKGTCSLVFEGEDY